jgi:formylglycine-generating enzyme required for sulfatase activity
MTEATEKPLRIFCSYSRRDEEHLNDLRDWLRPLERQGLIEWWHDREITPGWEWEEAIDKSLRSADIILFLVSPSFMASDYVYAKEVSVAVERHERGETHVIPIIVRRARWERAPFAKLQALPRDAKPVTTWNDRDEAWYSVAEGVESAVEALLHERQARVAETRAASQTLSSETPPDVTSILPQPFEWCYIPAGNTSVFTGFEGYETNEDYYANFCVERFYIAKYPITYEQFMMFVSSPSGYNNDQWWKGLDPHDPDWPYNDPHDPRSLWQPKENSDSSPRKVDREKQTPAYVQRYDAIAFCRWLAYQLMHTITVPSEVHWQRAAQGDDGRKYPWGNDFDPMRCNSGSSGIGRLTPVTKYTSGASPYDVFDLSGNAPEWCVLLAPGDRFPRYFASGDFHARNTSFADDDPEHFRGSYRGIADAPMPGVLACFRLCIPSPVFAVE